MQKSCGGCKHFLKMKRYQFGGGLCERKDRRTTSDRGGKCKEHKHIKLHRREHYNEDELSEAV